MKKFTLLNDGTYRNNENGQTNIHPGIWLYEEVEKWLEEGNIPDSEFTEEEIEEQNFKSSLDVINKQYEDDLNSPAICIVGVNVYEMDGKYDSAIRFKMAIDMFENIGETEIPMVDYNNILHYVSLADAKEINNQQAIYYKDCYMKRAIARDNLIKSRVGM